MKCMKNISRTMKCMKDTEKHKEITMKCMKNIS